jgi:hypothetical protein
MTALVRTRALITELAAALDITALLPDDSGGFHLTIGTKTDVYLYGGDDETILVVAPVATLPLEPEYGLVIYLLRNNLFDSDMTPFQTACDDGGALILWGRLKITDLDGAVLAGVVDRLAERVETIRAEVEGASESAEAVPAKRGPGRK